MSEYQFVHFMALDRPLSDEQLAYMQRQSTRAEITQWAFTNEYHYGDFHGNAREMLRRGYDVHLHYANYGYRRLMLRLPTGLPCDRRAFLAYRVEHSFAWIADKKGKGGILDIAPEGDPDAYDDCVYDVDAVLPKIAPVRGELMGGDLRALYLMWLVCNCDDDALEPPVPAGMGKLTPGLRALVEFYGLSGDLIRAAAQNSPPAPQAQNAGVAFQQWIAKQSKGELQKLVTQFLSDDAAGARADVLAHIRDEMETTTWPTAEPSRTWGELRTLADEVGDRRQQRERKSSETARRKQLTKMKTDPDKVIANVEKLVQQRSTVSYGQAASVLADLREALGPELGPARVREIAKSLRQKYPTLTHLVGAMRRQGLLEK